MFYFTDPDMATTIFDLNDDADHNGNPDEEGSDDQIDESAFSLKSS